MRLTNPDRHSVEIRSGGREGNLRKSGEIEWTNRSVLKLAGNEDPIAAVARRARELALRARDQGWRGPPFNPVAIADLLKIPVEPNADVADACTVATSTGLKIQFNPTQARERVRFSIAHELAHTLFPDVAEKTRHRGNVNNGDEWQLEMLCNVAAAEFVMPAGSLSAREQLPAIEQLMVERRRFDVSAEAYLIRSVKMTTAPATMFCASPRVRDDGSLSYRIDYAVSSPTAPELSLVGRRIPSNSAVYSCTAIGYTESAEETWPSGTRLLVECVGIPPYPGSYYPRVAGLIRFTKEHAVHSDLKIVHGNVLDPRETGALRIICQLVNDQARVWGGGVAKSAAKKFPEAQRSFSDWITKTPRRMRLGTVHFFRATKDICIASLIAQEGYGPSASPRIRYAALKHCLQQVADFAIENNASVHMPRIGAGQSGGSWETVEELVRETIVAAGVGVTIYDLPPRRAEGILDF